MKHICKYLLVILPLLVTLISCDNDDIPKYNQLELDATEVSFYYNMGEEIKGQKEVNITNGNGNYILTQVSNDLTSLEALDKIAEIEADGGNADTIVVATAKLDGNKLVVTPEYTGTIKFKLQDWTKSVQFITIVVDQDKPNEEIITRVSTFNIKVGGKVSTEIYSGNGGYKVESLDPSVATVVLDGLDITATAIATGNTKIKITDQKGEEGFIEVNVDDATIPLVLLDGPEAGERVWITTGGETTVFHYEGGNGGMGYTLSTLYGTVTIDEDVKTITITSKTYRSQTTLKVTDRYGQELAIDLAFDYPFLDDNRNRMLRDGKFPSVSITKRAAEYLPSINRSIIQFGTASSGIGITFTGDLNPGEKKDGRIYNVTSTGAESPGTETVLSQCEIVKVENKVYWISFTQEESGQKGYIVIAMP